MVIVPTKESWNLMLDTFDTSENPLLAAQLKEAGEVKQFLDSPVWKWLKTRLDVMRPKLMAQATAPKVKRDDRMILLGQISLIDGLLNRPALLTELLTRRDAAVERESMFAPVEVPVQPSYNPGML